MTTEFDDHPPSQPAAVTCFKVYAVVLCIVFYVTFRFVLALSRTDPPETADIGPNTRIRFQIAERVLIAVNGIFCISTIPPLILSPRPWIWTYSRWLLWLGMSSIVLLPVCMPLQFHWIRAETRRYYGKA